MAGLPKKYFKMFPGNLKKAWAKFKADRGHGSAPAASSHHKKSGSHSGHHKGGKMAKKSKSGAFESRPVKVLMFAAQAAAGGAATSFVLNKTPKVKDLAQGWKAAGQIGLGLAGLFLKTPRWVKGLAAGSVIMGGASAFKAVTKIDPLAGPGSGRPSLSPSQMNRLTDRSRMGVPANVRMGVPASVRMGGSRSSGWGSQGWG